MDTPTEPKLNSPTADLNLQSRLIRYGYRLLIWFAIASIGAFANYYFGVPKGAIPVPPPPIDITAILPSTEPEPLFFCGRTESIRDSLTTKPWPVKRITWHIDTSASPLPEQQVIEAFKAAWNSWAAGIDIEPVYVEVASGAMVRSRFGDYDGSGKVLAWSELADGTITTKHQLYDRAEKWGAFAGGGSGGGIDLVRVAAHEIGHVLGLFHDEGRGNALMDPIYSKTIRLPTEQDINRALTMGYKPAAKSPIPMGPLTIQFPVSAEADAVAEALRKAGFKVENPKQP